MELPELSVIIVNWNTADMLKGCLQSLISATNGLNHEIIVVDNGSTDGSTDVCDRFSPKIKLIKNKKNVGFGRANNQGISASKAKLVLLLNSDTIVLPGNIIKMINVLSDDQSIGVVGCRLILPNGEYQPSSMYFPTLKRIFVERLLLYKVFKNLPQTPVEPPLLKKREECDWVFGACMLIRKRVFESVGMFDPDFFMYGEEMDLCYRIRNKGWRIVFEPEAEILHLDGGSWKEKAYSATYLKVNGILCFYKKYMPFMTYIIAHLLCLSGAIIRLLVWSILYLFKKKHKAFLLLEVKTNFKLVWQLIKILPLRLTEKLEQA